MPDLTLILIVFCVLICTTIFTYNLNRDRISFKKQANRKTWREVNAYFIYNSQRYTDEYWYDVILDYCFDCGKNVKKVFAAFSADYINTHVLANSYKGKKASIQCQLHIGKNNCNMTVSPIFVADLDIDVPYANIKRTQMQRGVFKSFTVTGTDANGNLLVDIVNQDDTDQTQNFAPDALVYLVANE